MKKIILFLSFILILNSYSLFASEFEAHLATVLGLDGGLSLSESVKKGTFYTRETFVGPILGLDSAFIMKKNGFTIMANGAAVVMFIIQDNPDPYITNPYPHPRGMGLGAILNLELLFGYTYKPNNNFNLTIAAGPSFSVFYPAITARLSTAYYFSKKCGLYVSVGNSFGFMSPKMYGGRHSWQLMNSTTFAIGPVFKLGKNN